MSNYTRDRSVSSVTIHFLHMLFSSQQANACETRDYEVGHIEFTQFFSGLQA